MKTLKYLVIITAGLYLPMMTHSQSFTNNEKKSIILKTDSILNECGRYGGFTRNLKSISENYIAEYKKLFRNDSILIFNDLVSDPPLPFYISINEYIQKVKEWYPAGLTIALKNREYDPVVLDGDHYRINVRLTKSISANTVQESKPYQNQVPLNFGIRFDKNLANFRIASVLHTSYPYPQPAVAVAEKQPGTTTKTGPVTGITHTSGTKTTPDNNQPPLPKTLRKPVYLDIQYFSGSSAVAVSGMPTEPQVTRGFFYGFGAGFEKSVSKPARTELRYGVSVVYMNYSSDLELSTYYGEKTGTFDRLGKSVTLMNTLTDIRESLHLSMIEIPVTARLKYSLSERMGFYVTGGISFGFGAGGSYQSSARGDYQGKYDQYGGYIFASIYNSANRTLGYDFYPSVTSGNSSAEYKNTLSFGARGGAGLELLLTKGFALRFGPWINYYISSSTLKKEGTLLSENHDDLQSLLVTGNSKISAFGIEIGATVKIW